MVEFGAKVSARDRKPLLLYQPLPTNEQNAEKSHHNTGTFLPLVQDHLAGKIFYIIRKVPQQLNFMYFQN